ncbi:Formate dehydrogenase subunit alpha [Geodia barretti]|uniref:Formate dehydrogenase subunit alpha n=1 Tax=Geodia barretti TaxID=519541 RepID=A0AA35SG07_GEOBA|nr:Formate dehydrogenase subunit alpha [Geodia barretti]
MSNPLVDMEKPDVIFCIGTNMTECHPVAATRLKKAIARGAKLIVADPRRIGLAEMSDLYLPLRVGSDVALLLGMAHVIAREGLIDRDFIESRTTDSDAFLEHLVEFTPTWAGGDFRGACEGYRDRRKMSLCNLVLMTGNIGREGTGINPMRGQNNIQGAGDSGALPNNYPGFQPVIDPANQAKFKEIYGREIDLDKGITKVTALDLCGEEIRAMLIDGENTLLSDPDRVHCEHALRSLDHLVVIDIFLTDTADLRMSSCPRPPSVKQTAFARTQNVASSVCVQPCRRRVRHNLTGGSSANSPNGSALRVSTLANRKRSSTNCAVSHRSTQGSIGSVLRTASTSGPCLTKSPRHPTIARRGVCERAGYLLNRALPRSSGDHQRRLPCLADNRSARLQSYHTRTQTGRAQGIDYLLSEEALEVNPADVEGLGLRDGGWCELSSVRGAVKVKVKSTNRSPRGTVFASFSFSDVPVNILTGSGYDPITETAETQGVSGPC